jgi:hypothetical protein
MSLFTMLFKTKKTMRRCLLVLLPFAATSGTSYSQTTTQIPIFNAGFEALVLNCDPGGGCWNGAIPGWQPDWFNTGSGGTFKPGPEQFPAGVPGGVNCGYAGTEPGGLGGIFQALTATLQANTTYILHVSIGHRADEAFTGYVASLLALSVQVASDNSLNPAPGTFLEDTITYATGTAPALLDQRLAISIKSVGTGQVDVDNVSLTAIRQ